MGLLEIWIPEVLIVFFLLVPILRPLIKGLWHIDSLAWFPLIALGINIGLFPAYGIRPECIPILGFTFLYTLFNLRSFFSSFKSKAGNAVYERNIFLTVFSILFLVIVSIPMFAFTPKYFDSHDVDTVTEKITKISDTRTGKNYFLSVYGEMHNENPLIFIVPPDFGSSASIHYICSGLRESGFTVITYSREGYDSPLTTENRIKHFSSFGNFFTHWKTIRQTDPDIQGIDMESERKVDIEFLLTWLVNQFDDEDSLPPLILAGYGAGGSALTYIAEEDGLIPVYDNVLGIIAIESRLWTAALDSQSYTSLPVLFLVSGRILDLQEGNNPYQTVMNKFRFGSGHLALAAIESAGPLDYQDFPYTHPVYSFFLTGKKDAKKSENPVSDTIGIIFNFASFLLENIGYDEFPRHVIDGDLYIESKGISGFRLK